MKCPKCGYPMSWNAKRCVDCGWKADRLGADEWTRYVLAAKQEVAWFEVQIKYRPYEVFGGVK